MVKSQIEDFGGIKVRFLAQVSAAAQRVSIAHRLHPRGDESPSVLGAISKAVFVPAGSDQGDQAVHIVELPSRVEALEGSLNGGKFLNARRLLHDIQESVDIVGDADLIRAFASFNQGVLHLIEAREIGAGKIFNPVLALFSLPLLILIIVVLLAFAGMLFPPIFSLL